MPNSAWPRLTASSTSLADKSRMRMRMRGYCALNASITLGRK